MGFRIEDTPLAGLRIVRSEMHVDARGWFSETWNERSALAAGLTTHFVQDNHSHSIKKGTVRGLHYQRPPHAQDKLVRCTRGSVLDVALDARLGSSTYGKWFGITLKRGDNTQLLIPKGFLHGFITLEDDSELQYKCSDFYSRDCDGVVRWDSAGIDWQVSCEVTVSEKDESAPSFSSWNSPFSFGVEI